MEKIGEEPIVLSDESRARLNDVRRNLWVGGARGFLVGMSGCVLIYIAIRFHPRLKEYRRAKYLLTITLTTSSLFAYFGALVRNICASIDVLPLQQSQSAGKNAFAAVGDILKKNSKPRSNYAKILQENERDSLNSFDRRYEAIKNASRVDGKHP